MAVTRPLTLFCGDVCPFGMGAGPMAVHVGPVLVRFASCRRSVSIATWRALYVVGNGAPRYRAICWARRDRYVASSTRRPTGGRSGSPMPMWFALARSTASGSAVAVVGLDVELALGTSAPTTSATTAKTNAARMRDRRMMRPSPCERYVNGGPSLRLARQPEELWVSPQWARMTVGDSRQRPPDCKENQDESLAWIRGQLRRVGGPVGAPDPASAGSGSVPPVCRCGTG